MDRHESLKSLASRPLFDGKRTLPSEKKGNYWEALKSEKAKRFFFRMERNISIVSLYWSANLFSDTTRFCSAFVFPAGPRPVFFRVDLRVRLSLYLFLEPCLSLASVALSFRPRYMFFGLSLYMYVVYSRVLKILNHKPLLKHCATIMEGDFTKVCSIMEGDFVNVPRLWWGVSLEQDSATTACIFGRGCNKLTFVAIRSSTDYLFDKVSRV